MTPRFGRKAALVAGIVIGLAIGGTFAFATIPDSTNGSVTACYPTTGASKGILRVIDAQTGAHCAVGEAKVVLGSSRCTGFPHVAVNWSGCNYRHSQLAGQNFTSALLVGTNLTESNLSSALLNTANLGSANLTDAVLTLAPMRAASLISANLTRTQLGGADLSGARLTGAVFLGTRIGSSSLRTNLTAVSGLTSDQLRGVQQDAPLGGTLGLPVDCTENMLNLVNVKLSNDDLSSFDLHAAEATATDFTGATMAGTDFTCSLFFGTNFAATDMSSTILTNTSFIGANLQGANLQGVDLSTATFQNTICPDGTKSTVDGNTCANNLI